jgi:hypothetical protein
VLRAGCFVLNAAGEKRGADVIARSLRRYADRGVFRGFTSRADRRGRLEFQFTWLTREPVTITYEPKSGALTFRHLLPGLRRSSALADVTELIDDRNRRSVPGHKRVDGRRAQISWFIARGGLSLTVTVKGRHHEYGVRRGLNLVNDLFVLLHASYPDYLTEHFGLPAE